MNLLKKKFKNTDLRQKKKKTKQKSNSSNIYCYAIMAAIGNSTRHGFLIREGDALERLAKVSYVAFDKTGTLTLGTPQVVAVRSFQEPISPETLFSWAASAEQRSENPLGKAVVSCFKQKYVPGSIYVSVPIPLI